MKINNQFILHELSSMYRNSPNIINFMEQAYLYCKENEKDIMAVGNVLNIEYQNADEKSVDVRLAKEE